MGALTTHCTHYTLHSLHTALTTHCTHYTLHSLHTALTTHCTHTAPPTLIMHRHYDGDGTADTDQSSSRFRENLGGW
jgi:hypothetical protein